MAVKGLKLIIIGCLCFLTVGMVAAASNPQPGTPPPTIIGFNADAGSVNYADVEAGTAQVTLAWNTINTTAQNRVGIDAFQGNNWVSVFGNQALPLDGSEKITVALPQNFGVPTYRLTLKSAGGQTLGQQFITIPYSASAEAAPGIASFTTAAQSVDTNLLVQNNARLIIHWQIVNRQPDTLIRFEQILPDGSAIPAEEQRPALWLPSEGDSAVYPRTTASRSDLLFRMTLVNVNDGTVYDQQELTIPVIGHVMVANPGTNTGRQTTTARNTNGGNQINTFSAASTSVTPGGSVTLNWDAGDAQSVDLLQSVDQGGPTTLYIVLPPTGSLTVPVPDDAPGVTYTLRAESADGQVSTGEVNVTPADTQGSGDTQGNGG